ncbi:Osteocrin [Labeo rohita]|uniref:Osteocrin n=1 Tax=Labeo rohita TaxID=84645 RepID=A0ABQ8M0I2_LABRO|nr:Osteocrin [Labeo rohita]
MLLDNAFPQSWGRRGAASGPVLSAPDLKCQGRDTLGQTIGENALLGIFGRYATILQKSFKRFLGEILWQGRGVQRGQTEQKTSGAVNAKLLLHDQLFRLENDVIEPKRKRSFPGSNTPLDRLSISTMDPKSNKQRKAVELPRRRVIPPIDRIGVGRLPNNRG